MAGFPVLKTGAVAQYPMSTSATFATRVLRFVDGREQRIRLRGNPERRWVVPLALLDDGELAAVEEFVASVQGTSQEFEFTDPFTGLVFPRCRLAADDVTLQSNGAEAARTQVEIVEVVD